MVKIFKVFVPVSVLVLLVCETAILYGCYVAGVYLAQAMFEGPLFAEGFLLDDNGFLRILIAVATIMLGLYFNDLYESFQIRSRIQLIQQVCLAVGVALFYPGFYGLPRHGLDCSPLHHDPRKHHRADRASPLPDTLCHPGVQGVRGGTAFFSWGRPVTLKELAKGIEEKPTMGLKIIGYLDDGAGGDEPLPGITRLGTIQDLAKVLDPKPNRIVVGLTERRNRLPIQELLELRFSGIRIEEATQLYEAAFGRVCTREFRPSQLIFSEDLGPRSGSETLQSVYCFVFAVVLLILTSPLMLLVALAVRLTSPGPILLRQKRVGRGDAGIHGIQVPLHV